MKAAVITGVGRVEIASVEDPAPGSGQAVVAVSACGLCGTDPAHHAGRVRPVAADHPGARVRRGDRRAIQDGLEPVGPAGTFLQFGVADYATRVTIDPFGIYNKEITITGSMAVLHRYERAAELFATGVLNPATFITDRLPLQDYALAIERFASGARLKMQVLP